MTLSKKIKTLASAISLVFPVSLAMAEDIDLYQGGPDVTGNKPNVLIILDNSANWSSAKQGWPGDKQGDAELTAISNVLNTLGSDVRVGLMMFTKGGGSEIDGGYVRYAIRDMDPTNKTALREIIHNIRDVAQITNPEQKVNDAVYSNAFREAYQYFSGATRYSAADPKRDYANNGSSTASPFTAGNLANNAFSDAATARYNGPLSAAASANCAKNFIIFIGNGFPSTDIASAPALPGFNGTQIYATSGGKVNFADEWARYLKNVGVVTPCEGEGDARVCADGTITTYAIDVYKDKPEIDQNNLLKSMADVGGGEYFAATSEAAIEDALQSIFNQVQAVNSVFASSSLPVSVNTQGTYLNQIYMGVFRPDAKATPRWLGNLKQYKFKITTDAKGVETLVLADADDIPAVSSTTGFIKSDARSYWTHNSSFWTKIYTKSTADYSDNPDGALVEKGATAQQLRESAADFSQLAARKMLTCIPNCTTGTTPANFHTGNEDLLTAMNTVSTSVSLRRAGPTVTADTAANHGLSDTPESITISGSLVPAYNGSWMATRVDDDTFTFTIPETPATPATGTMMTVSSGTGVPQTVLDDKMTFSNGKVTVNLPSHGFVTGQSITIAGAKISPAMASAPNKCSGWATSTNCEYNGTFTITVVDANNFTYTPPSSNYGYTQTTESVIDPPEASVGKGFSRLTCRDGGTIEQAHVPNSSITRVAGGSNGDTRRVTVTLASRPAPCAEPLTAVNGVSKRVIALELFGSDSDVLNSVTHTIAGGIKYGTADCGGPLSYCFDVKLVSRTIVTETITILPATPATPAVDGTPINATGIPTRKVTKIVRGDGNSSNIATVTLTTDGSHVFDTATSILVSGAEQSEYNGTKSTANSDSAGKLLSASGNTITYTVLTGPTATATGTFAKGANQVPAVTLINWMRGVDNKDDENKNGSLTDVRASIHGDVLHSRPAIINYGVKDGEAEPTIIAYYGANDGTLRAVKGGQANTDGGEKWAFVAPEHKNTWNRLYANSPKIKFPGGTIESATKRDYFFDGNIGVYQSTDLATTHIFATMRRGGRAIYAFDVSDPDDPKFLWTRSNASTSAAADAPTRNGHASFAEMGQTWSTPKVVPIKKTTGEACNLSDTDTYTRALIMGAGYDPVEEDKDNQGAADVVRSPTMGRGVFVMDAATGELIKLLQPADEKKYSFAADVTLMDADGDGCVDRLYAADTGANLFRFDIGDPDASKWKTYKIARLGDVGNNGGSDDRKFLYAPDPVVYSNGLTHMTFLMVGSGNREEPRDEAIRDMFFMVKDPVPAGGTTDAVEPARVDADGTKRLIEVTNFNAATTSLTTATVTGADFHGWYIPFDKGEKTVNAPLTISGVTYFGTNLPKPPEASCTPNLGIARGYALNFLSGTSAAGDRDANSRIDKSDLYANLIGGGLPPSPVAGTVCIDGNCKRFCIGCGSNDPKGSAIEASKVHATPDPRRKRVFWYYKKDE